MGEKISEIQRVKLEVGKIWDGMGWDGFFAWDGIFVGP